MPSEGDFASSSSSSSASQVSFVPSAGQSLRTTDEGIESRPYVQEWEGSTIFTDIVTSGPSTTRTKATPKTPKGQDAGTATSPISISSSSPSPLTRPRGKVKHISNYTRTAFTPPRPIKPLHPTSSASTIPSDKLEKGKSKAVSDNTLRHDGYRSKAERKPLHPFFNYDRRAKSAPLPPVMRPPPSQRPRLVAHYSSTSASASTSQSTSAEASQEQSAGRPIGKDVKTANLKQKQKLKAGTWSVDTVEMELVNQWVESPPVSPLEMDRPEDVEGYHEETISLEELDKLAGMLEEMKLPSKSLRPIKTSKNPSSDRLLHEPRSVDRPDSTAINNTNTGTAKEKVGPLSATRPTVIKSSKKGKGRADALNDIGLPEYDHTTFSPRPKVVYTSDLDEANDLLSSLKGNVFGFDMEWPIAGQRDEKERTVGVGWDPVTRKKKYFEVKTALLQFCDEHLVVLVHIWNMPRIPEKVIEILQDPEIYKVGVAISNDGKKLRRDFPDTFPQGISAMLELSKLARKVDPIGTGPGGTLISLANLVRGYLKKELDKSSKVRQGRWMLPLSEEAVHYAANDVHCGLQLYRAFNSMADEQEITLHNVEFCSYLGNAKHPKMPHLWLKRLSSTQTSGSVVGPSKLEALEMFKGGISTAAIAERKGIKIDTARSYVLEALADLPEDTLDIRDRQRLHDDVSKSSGVQKYHGTAWRKLRESISPSTSDTDETDKK